MRGIELAYKYYAECGKEMLEKEFLEVQDRITVGLAGEGSECFGFDDDISEDHDFGAGFCLWVSDEDYESFGFQLERAYAKLPKEFEGYPKAPVSAVGGLRRGVMKTSDFYTNFLGVATLPESYEHWLSIPSFSLACATNGRIFKDGTGDFSDIRRALLCGYPEDVRLKKLAAHAIFIAQSGLYNYPRLIKRGENGAAQLAVFEFVKHSISFIYLLNNAYEPFYKWAYRRMRELDTLPYLESSLVALTELGNEKAEADAKAESIEEICVLLTDTLKALGLTDSESRDIERQAYSLQNRIKDSALRNMHIMVGA